MIRLRILTKAELSAAEYDGWPLVITVQRANRRDQTDYAVLEQRHDSADPWEPVEVQL